MKSPRFLLVLALAFQCAAAFGETVKDREGAVRNDRTAWNTRMVVE